MPVFYDVVECSYLYHSSTMHLQVEFSFIFSASESNLCASVCRRGNGHCCYLRSEVSRPSTAVDYLYIVFVNFFSYLN